MRFTFRWDKDPFEGNAVAGTNIDRLARYCNMKGAFFELTANTGKVSGRYHLIVYTREVGARKVEVFNGWSGSLHDLMIKAVIELIKFFEFTPAERDEMKAELFKKTT